MVMPVPDLHAVSIALADAFADDPLQRWFTPPRDYPDRTARLGQLDLGRRL